MSYNLLLCIVSGIAVIFCQNVLLSWNTSSLYKMILFYLNWTTMLNKGSTNYTVKTEMLISAIC